MMVEVASDEAASESRGGARIFLAVLAAVQLVWLALIGYCISLIAS
jgi:hypothetical protein